MHIETGKTQISTTRGARNPYKGLHAFTSDDADDFFGRSAFVDELALLIESMPTREKKGDSGSRLLAVVGPVGTGKSSVVMAGLLPLLQAGGVFDSEDWIYLNPLVPGEHPVESLAQTLHTHLPEKDLQTIRNDLQDVAGLHLYNADLLKRAGADSTHVVLVIDQFEEIFTLTDEEAERRQFVDLLMRACMQQEGPLIVILTLQADFVPRLAEYPDLAALVQQHQATPPVPTSDELRAMIVQPARLPDVSVGFEEGLVDTLLSDAQGLPEVLPKLQFTLFELFQRRTNNQLTLRTYRELGGLKGTPAPSARHTSSKQEPAFLQTRATRRPSRTLLNLAVIALLLIALLGAAGEYYVNRQPSPLLVTNLSNSGTGSLRWCMDNAPTGSTITFDPRVKGTITLTGRSLTMQAGKELTLNGPGAERLTLRSSDARPVLVVPAKSTLTVSRLSFQGGKQAKQSILLNSGMLTLNHSSISGNSSSGDGGGITSTDGTLILNYSSISGNSAENNGGGIYFFHGTLALNNSTIMQNTSSTGNGGGIYFFAGTLTMRNSTIARNSSAAGGGIYSYNNTLSLLNDTIADNSATSNGGGIFSYNSKITLDKSTVFHNTSASNGGGISINAPDSPTDIRDHPVVLERSIIAGNRGNQDLDVSGTVISGGYNLFGHFAGANFLDPQRLHGTDKEVNELNDLHIDNTLNENGGTTMTHALLVGSPAIDAIPTSACDLKTADTDQRGVRRPQGEACDIGAYEYQARS